MAVRGAESKKIVEQKLLEVFPGAFIKDKKVYVNFNEGGEPVQICISMTCPKTLVDSDGTFQSIPAGNNGGVDFDAYLQKKPSIDFTDSEKETIEMLLSKL